MNAAALVPIVVVLAGFEVFCLVDVARAAQVRYLPKWAWAVICLVSVPLGGLAYEVCGQAQKSSRWRRSIDAFLGNRTGNPRVVG